MCLTHCNFEAVVTKIRVSIKLFGGGEGVRHSLMKVHNQCSPSQPDRGRLSSVAPPRLFSGQTTIMFKLAAPLCAKSCKHVLLCSLDCFLQFSTTIVFLQVNLET